MQKLLALVLFGISIPAWATSSLTTDFKEAIAKYKLGSISNHSYCYSSDNENEDGYQLNKMMPIASLSKLFTTFYATELLDLNKTYQTKFLIKGSSLHIQGGNDPYFEEEKMFLLLDALNSQGYTKFTTVTFDKNFKFSDVALGKHEILSAAHIAERLRIYLNTKSNAKYLNNKLSVIKKFASEENVTLPFNLLPSMQVTTVKLVNRTPFNGTEEYSLTHTSKPLHKILKAMNVMSKNLVSQYIFEEASKKLSFTEFLKQRGFNTKTINLHNGSGLPVLTQSGRVDNTASCLSVIKLMDSLKKSIEANGFKHFEILAVGGGKDNGSFRDRFLKYPELEDSVLAKTGTLAVASTLAGILSTSNGEVHFAILNKTPSTQAARNFQDYFTSRFFHHLGEAVPVPYQKISIFPWTDLDFFDI